MHKSLQRILSEQLEKNPQRRAITFYSGTEGYSWCTVEQFYKQAAGYAEQLADYGLGKGDTCILVLHSGEFCAKIVLATLMVGAVPLLMAPPVLQGEAAYSSLMEILTRIMRKTRPRIVICSEEMVTLRDELRKGRRRTRFLFGEGSIATTSTSTIPFANPGDTEVAAMQLTSGTTGFPRVCVWQQKSVVAALDGMAQAMKLTDDDVCLNWTPLYHDMGLVNNFLLCMTTGVPLVMMSPLDFVKTPALWLRGLSETGATITWSPNFGFAIASQLVRDEEIDGVSLERVRAFWNAAERIHYETMVSFYHRFAPIGVRFEALKTNFGCAENVGGATFSDLKEPFAVERLEASVLLEKGLAHRLSDSDDNAQAVSVVGVGRPVPGMRIRILSARGRPLPDGHVGEVALETASRMVGYLGDARATRRALNGTLLRTGDLGYMRDGELFWVGRVRERITVRGTKMDPSDFEPILLQIAGLRHGCFVAFGVDDERQGTQRIVIVAEVRDSTARQPKEICSEIRREILMRLGVTVNDILLVQRGTLTKTSSGKRRHRYFRRLYLEGKLKEFEWRSNGIGGVGPRTEEQLFESGATKASSPPVENETPSHQSSGSMREPNSVDSSSGLDREATE